MTKPNKTEKQTVRLLEVEGLKVQDLYQIGNVRMYILYPPDCVHFEYLAYFEVVAEGPFTEDQAYLIHRICAQVSEIAWREDQYDLNDYDPYNLLRRLERAGIDVVAFCKEVVDACEHALPSEDAELDVARRIAAKLPRYFAADDKARKKRLQQTKSDRAFQARVLCLLSDATDLNIDDYGPMLESLFGLWGINEFDDLLARDIPLHVADRYFNNIFESDCGGIWECPKCGELNHVAYFGHEMCSSVKCPMCQTTYDFEYTRR